MKDARVRVIHKSFRVEMLRSLGKSIPTIDLKREFARAFHAFVKGRAVWAGSGLQNGHKLLLVLTSTTTTFDLAVNGQPHEASARLCGTLDFPGMKL